MIRYEHLLRHNAGCREPDKSEECAISVERKGDDFYLTLTKG